MVGFTKHIYSPTKAKKNERVQKGNSMVFRNVVEICGEKQRQREIDGDERRERGFKRVEGKGECVCERERERK